MFQAADHTHPKYFPVLDREIARLRDLLVSGIAEVYDDFDDFLCDWGADFSWTTEACVLQFQELLGSQEWLGLAAQLKEARGYDFVDAIAQDLACVWSGEF